eukprot:TRINITY_DN21153_c0_g1_i3.p1 TRINITY_DN21153_c0_g1~~TRINITY_DN21153_c0_g1_i3.p1  ORF type:complete len:698 (+),score=156.36 TRINITY_DN21153_c0_g1_i3:89-2095(+)
MEEAEAGNCADAIAALDDDPGLLSLDVDDAGLDVKAVKKLARVVGKHESLKDLDISRNKVGDKGGSEALAKAVQKSASLRVLMARNVGMKEAGAERLAEALERNPQLAELNLCLNKLGDKGARRIAEALPCCSGLSLLDLSSCGISSSGAMALADALRPPGSDPAAEGEATSAADAHAAAPAALGAVAAAAPEATEAGESARPVPPGLVTLRLRDNRFDDDAIAALAAVVEEPSTSLRELDLARTGVTLLGAQKLASALATSPLCKLGLFGNAQIGVAGVDALVPALRHNRTLKDLDLSGCGLGDAGAGSLARALLPRTAAAANGRGAASQKRVRRLRERADDEEFGDSTSGSSSEEDDEDKDGVESAQATEIATTAAELEGEGSRLTDLHLCRNTIRDEGARSFAQVLERNSDLLVLSLTDNDLGDLGVVALAQALKKNFSLRELHLGRTRAGDWGAKELGLALVMNVALTCMVLQGNEIGDAGAIGLAVGLERNSALMELDLSRNRIGDEGARALASLAGDCVLTSLDLEGNDADEAILERLAESLNNRLAFAPPAPAASPSPSASVDGDAADGGRMPSPDVSGRAGEAQRSPSQPRLPRARSQQQIRVASKTRERAGAEANAAGSRRPMRTPSGTFLAPPPPALPDMLPGGSSLLRSPNSFERGC